jgi:hypothetical protein
MTLVLNEGFVIDGASMFDQITRYLPFAEWCVLNVCVFYTTVPIMDMEHKDEYSLVESTQRVYDLRLFFSARTTKRHHNHFSDVISCKEYELYANPLTQGRSEPESEFRLQISAFGQLSRSFFHGHSKPEFCALPYESSGSEDIQLYVVSARTNKMHHHHQGCTRASEATRVAGRERQRPLTRGAQGRARRHASPDGRVDASSA